MLQEEYITIELKYQQYSCKTYMRKEEGTEGVVIFESKQRTEDIHCPYCGGPVHIWDTVDTSLRDMPIQAETRQDVLFLHHRYRCTKCHRKHTEGIPSVYPGTRITECAATWIKTLLLNKMPVKAIQGITGIHWETIRRIHMDMLETTLSQHMEALKASGYKPKYLAVDEFAIHKGHTYATCVMDLETGEVLWVGSGCSKEDFNRFFDEIEPSFMTDIRAIAMDMHASYHILVKQKMPGVQIVYDRFHMQAQYGKEVLGVVRLAEARKHKALSQELNEKLSDVSADEKRELKEQIRAEKQNYSTIKKLRWTLLISGDKLSANQTSDLQNILNDHSDLAICYAMKEELASLFELRDPSQAEAAWKNWFSAAKQSGILPLVRFAELKE